MSKWTYTLVVNNQTDRPLKLLSKNIPYGKVNGSLPDKILPGEEGVYTIYSPAGKASGIEFYLIFKDESQKDEPSYGTMSVSVDMPFWKHKNKSSCITTDFLVATGFEKVPAGNHDFMTSVTVSTSL